MENVHSFTAAVRGYHYYRRFWKPEEKQKLNCMHELNNPYDGYAIKLFTLNGETVGYLLKELLRITKFITHHLKTLQTLTIGSGWNGIACLVVTRMPATRRNTEITEKFLTLVKELYAEPKEEEILR